MNTVIIGTGPKAKPFESIDGYPSMFEDKNAFWIEDQALATVTIIYKNHKYGKELEKMIQGSLSHLYVKAWVDVLMVERMRMKDFRAIIVGALKQKRDLLKEVLLIG